MLGLRPLNLAASVEPTRTYMVVMIFVALKNFMVVVEGSGDDVRMRIRCVNAAPNNCDYDFMS